MDKGESGSAGNKMPSGDSNYARLKGGTPPAIVPPPPRIPDDVKKRFPSLVEYERKLEEWAKKNLAISIRGGPG